MRGGEVGIEDSGERELHHNVKTQKPLMFDLFKPCPALDLSGIKL